MHAITFVIPCFNEAKRLQADQLEALVAEGRVRALLVDDGSTDGTLALLTELTRRLAPNVDHLALRQNVGKAEAVRQGMLLAAQSSAIVGYADADFATPPEELRRLAEVIEERGVDVVLGSRVALAGTRIDRHPARHYLGRVFGTAASFILEAVIYDTQCGAKLFRVNDLLRAALSVPFGSRWAFDVELLGRLLIGTREAPPVAPDKIIEQPLRAWVDVGGSKLSVGSMIRTPVDLLRTAARLRQWRAAAGR